MCLLTRQIKPKTTKKDMIVLKRLRIEDNNDNSISYYSYYSHDNFEYVPGILNTVEFGITRRKPIGISAFADIDGQFYRTGPLVNRKLTVIEEGFHFLLEDAKSLDDLTSVDRKYLFKFLIPKGSQIFLGATGLGATNQIIMLKP